MALTGASDSPDSPDWDGSESVTDDIRLGSIGESIAEEGFRRKFKLLLDDPAAPGGAGL